MAHEIKLRVNNIEKSFPGVKALNQINFSVKKGTVHVLCGENGAGKSTLMKIINGIYTPDAGEIYIDEKKVKISNPLIASRLGISMIFQEMNYIPEITVAEALFLGNWPLKSKMRINWKEMQKKAKELLENEDLNYGIDTKLKDLTISEIQMLEITKAVSQSSSMIIMDEPTSAISKKEVEHLFNKIRQLKERGVSIIYISHKLDEVFQIADEITILRDGSVVDTKAAADISIDEIITKMVGRKLEQTYPKEHFALGEEILKVEKLCGLAFKDVSFTLKRGEILGFSGLMGAGRTEVVRALFGLDPILSGKIFVHGKEIAVKYVKNSLDNGLVLLGEDRRRYGIIPMRSVKENCSISSLDQIIYGGFLHKRKELNLVSTICERMAVKTPTFETPIQSLSGGNQQKVLLARWMLKNPEILLLDEPTRGIDIGAKHEIYKLMTELAKEGKAVIMISSELPELIGMCDRIYVMHQGQISGEINSENFSQENIMRYATGQN